MINMELKSFDFGFRPATSSAVSIADFGFKGKGIWQGAWGVAHGVKGKNKKR
jgi:hypothetical protein